MERQFAALIRIANVAEGDSLRPSTLIPAEKPGVASPPSVVASQVATLELVTSACVAGMSLDEIQIDVLGPVIEAGIVGDLAWRSIREVMSAATAKLRRLTDVPGEGMRYQ